MFQFKRFALIALILLSIASVRPVAATGDPSAHPACDPDGLQESGAVYRICMPTFPPWNGDLVVYAHGYVSPTEPVGIPEDQMTLAPRSGPLRPLQLHSHRSVVRLHQLGQHGRRPASVPAGEASVFAADDERAVTGWRLDKPGRVET